MVLENWVLRDLAKCNASIRVEETDSSISNGKITARVSSRGKISIYNSKGALLLEQYSRNRQGVLDPKCWALEIQAREFRPILGGDYPSDDATRVSRQK